jgi:hypothetical protein
MLLLSPLLQVLWQDPRLLLKLVASNWMDASTESSQLIYSLIWTWLLYGWVAWQRRGLLGGEFAVWMRSLPVSTQCAQLVMGIILLECSFPLLLLYLLAYSKLKPALDTALAGLLPWLFADALIVWFACQGRLTNTLFAMAGRTLLGPLHPLWGLGCLLLAILIKPLPRPASARRRVQRLLPVTHGLPIATLARLLLGGLWQQHRAALLGRLLIGVAIVAMVCYACHHLEMADRAWGLSVVGATIILAVLHGLHDNCQELLNQAHRLLLPLPITPAQYVLARNLVVTCLAAALLIALASAQIKLLDLNALAGLLLAALGAAIAAGQVPLHWQSWRLVLVYGGIPLAMFSTWYFL